MKKQRPSDVAGCTFEARTGCGKLFVTVNALDDKPFEVFLNMGKAGGCASAQNEAIGRMVTYALRIGGDIEEIVKELTGIRCHQPTDTCTSCADAVGGILKIAKSTIGSAEEEHY